MKRVRSTWRGASRPGPSGSTSTRTSRRTRRSAASSSRASESRARCTAYSVSPTSRFSASSTDTRSLPPPAKELAMLLNRDDWYETSRDLEWTFSYVDPAEAFPTSWSGADGVPAEAWQKWEEPFRVSYRDYVRIQREKEA